MTVLSHECSCSPYVVARLSCSLHILSSQQLLYFILYFNSVLTRERKYKMTRIHKNLYFHTCLSLLEILKRTLWRWVSIRVKHQIIILKKLDALCELFSLKSFSLLYYDLKFSESKVCLCVCVCVVCLCGAGYDFLQWLVFCRGQMF